METHSRDIRVCESAKRLIALLCTKEKLVEILDPLVHKQKMTGRLGFVETPLFNNREPLPLVLYLPSTMR